MLDFVKFRIEDKSTFEVFCEKKGIIELNSTFNRYTGAVSDYPKKGRFHNLEITVTEKYAYISGSVHKFFNHIRGLKDVNYDDFDIGRCLLAIDWICEYFRINKEKTTVTKLEFGFNIQTEYIVKDVIRDNIVMWNFDTHIEKKEYKSNGGISKKFGLSEYWLKIYAKGEESAINLSNLMRIELKIVSTRILRKLKISTLADISPDAFESLFKRFIHEYDKLLIIDSIKPSNSLEFHEMAYFVEYTKYETWNKNKKTKSPYQRKKDEKILRGLINQSNYNSIQTALKELICEKYIQLISMEKHLHN